jgi:hypothetical protein
VKKYTNNIFYGPYDRRKRPCTCLSTDSASTDFKFGPLASEVGPNRHRKGDAGLIDAVGVPQSGLTRHEICAMPNYAVHESY